MNKSEFLKALGDKLGGIPQDDRAERIGFYSEMIDDRIEDGLTEEEAVAGLGDLEEITRQVVSELPLKKLVKEKVKPGRTLRVWEIVLLILGSPIWLSLLLALFMVILSVYIVLWSVIITLWALEISLIACVLGGICSAIVNMAGGMISSGIFMLGMGLISAGLGVFGFFGCKQATRGIIKLTEKIFLWIKFCFVKKEREK